MTESNEAKPRKPSCGNCHSWQPSYDGSGAGECRRNPPTPDKYHHAKFPMIQDNEWCTAHAVHIFEVGEYVLHDGGKHGVVVGIEVYNTSITVSFPGKPNPVNLPIVYLVQLEEVPHVSIVHFTNLMKQRK